MEFSFPPPLVPEPHEYTAESLDELYTQAVTLWPGISRTSCANALASRFADGDVQRAAVLLQFFMAAKEGYVTSVCKHNGTYLPLRGAINLGGVSCYLDSLLVAMFSRMENFEPLLYLHRYEDEHIELLATWLRLFVNLLRNGERITSDIVGGLLSAAVSAGWTAGGPPMAQQDAAEFFVFITSKLKMPLLALKVDIAHAGKEQQEFDHKLVKEQLLYLPVPGNDQDPPILLEECLEIYFSNQISVRRHLERPSSGAASGSGASGSGASGSGASGSGASAPQNLNRIQSFASTSSLTLQEPGARRRSYSILSLASPGSARKFSKPAIEDSPQFRSPFECPSTPRLATPPTVTVKSPNSGDQQTMPESPRGTLQPSPIPDVIPIARSIDHDSERNIDHVVDRDANQDADQNADQVVGYSTMHRSELYGSSEPPSYHQLFGFNNDGQEEARVRDMKQNLWTSNNEIMLPAWMFLQLMPFYSADTDLNRSEALNNLEAEEVASLFGRQRPVLGLCLKRYYFNEDGQPQRNNRVVVVPETISLPSFVADDSDQKQAFGNFQLVLESAVFHRGGSIHSGHYCALIAQEHMRKPPASAASSTYNTMTAPDSHRVSWLPQQQQMPSRSSNVNNSAGMNSKRWYIFDDMEEKGNRMKEVDFTTVFEKETPYLLFYRMVSLDDEAGETATATSQPNASCLQTTPSSLLDVSEPPSRVASPQMLSYHPPSQPTSRAPSRPPSPQFPDQDKKRKKFFRRHHKDKDKDKTRAYATRYREEKCLVM